MAKYRKASIEKLTFSDPPVVMVGGLIHRSCGTIIFLHGGVGNSGTKEKLVIDTITEGKFCFPALKLIYPTAPKILVPNNPNPKIAWIDVKGDGPEYAEATESLIAACELVDELIKKEAIQTPITRIVLGGSDIGGRVAIEYACRYQTKLGGVFAISTYVNDDSPLYKDLTKIGEEIKLPKLFISHAIYNQNVKTSWVENTFNQLQRRGLNVELELSKYPCGRDKYNEEQLLQVKQWIDSIITHSIHTEQ